MRLKFFFWCSVLSTWIVNVYVTMSADEKLLVSFERHSSRLSDLEQPGFETINRCDIRVACDHYKILTKRKYLGVRNFRNMYIACKYGLINIERVSNRSITIRGLRMVTCWSWSLDKSYLPLQVVGSPLEACSVYGDLKCAVHTVNKLRLFNYQ